MSNRVIEAIGELVKYNPYHDAKGRFSSHDGAHTVSTRGADGKGGAEGSHTTALGMQHKSGGKLGKPSEVEWKEGGFDNTRDATSYIMQYTGKFEHPQDMPLSSFNSIAGGLHDAGLKQRGITVGSIKVEKLDDGTAATYGRGKVALITDPNRSSANAFGILDELKITTAYAMDVAKYNQRGKEWYKKHRSKKLRELKEGWMGDPATHAAYKTECKRWGVSSDDKDPLRTTVAHEAGHAVMRQGKGVSKAWADNLKANGIEKKSHALGLSEYGSSSLGEMFAETHAAVSRGRRNIVPDGILRAYDTTLKNYTRQTHRED